MALGTQDNRFQMTSSVVSKKLELDGHRGIDSFADDGKNEFQRKSTLRRFEEITDQVTECFSFDIDGSVQPSTPELPGLDRGAIHPVGAVNWYGRVPGRVCS